MDTPKVATTAAPAQAKPRSRFEPERIRVELEPFLKPEESDLCHARIRWSEFGHERCMYTVLPKAVGQRIRDAVERAEALRVDAHPGTAPIPAHTLPEAGWL